MLAHSFPPASTSPRDARRAVRKDLWRWPPATRELAALLVTELATNAVVHGDTTFSVTVSTAKDSVHIEVTDHGGGYPTLLAPDFTRLTGRGLHIVDRSAARWGTSTEANETTVWFEVDGTPAR